MNRYLLDTHALIWFRIGNPAFKANHKKLIENNEIFVSIASLWETALLLQKGKLASTLPTKTFLQDLIEPTFSIIPLEIEQFDVSNTLHHKDPFDRILIAQAISRDLTLLTKDEIISKYPVKTTW